MSDRIKILDGKKEGYTAKEAMQHVIEYTTAKTLRTIEIVKLSDSKEVGAESLLFVKMFLRFLHKNGGRVFLLAQNETMMDELQAFLEEKYSGIHIVETANWEDNVASHDMILNHINGAEADHIIAALSDDEQAEFLEQYRTALDVKIWLGLGTHLKKKKGKISFLDIFRINKFYKNRNLRK